MKLFATTYLFFNDKASANCQTAFVQSAPWRFISFHLVRCQPGVKRKDSIIGRKLLLIQIVKTGRALTTTALDPETSLCLLLTLSIIAMQVAFRALSNGSLLRRDTDTTNTSFDDMLIQSWTCAVTDVKPLATFEENCEMCSINFFANIPPPKNIFPLSGAVLNKRRTPFA